MLAPNLVFMALKTLSTISHRKDAFKMFRGTLTPLLPPSFLPRVSPLILVFQGSLGATF
jgi:hypothetical protein